MRFVEIRSSSEKESYDSYDFEAENLQIARIVDTRRVLWRTPSRSKPAARAAWRLGSCRMDDRTICYVKNLFATAKAESHIF